MFLDSFLNNDLNKVEECKTDISDLNSYGDHNFFDFHNGNKPAQYKKGDVIWGFVLINKEGEYH